MHLGSVVTRAQKTTLAALESQIWLMTNYFARQLHVMQPIFPVANNPSAALRLFVFTNLGDLSCHQR